ncbi:hypothetical protein WA026_023334 [Henosepilachna vigintioctopunctata]|uniref:Uncharacterized protein n=1 Tax=Henosepilachna vigintioctopunctata TaxID=420089 RepID=A0AAW1VH77_9CUCU
MNFGIIGGLWDSVTTYLIHISEKERSVGLVSQAQESQPLDAIHIVSDDVTKSCGTTLNLPSEENMNMNKVPITGSLYPQLPYQEIGCL